jgi:hypothetical protein
MKFAAEGAIMWRMRVHIAEVSLELIILDRQVSPANHTIAPQQRQRIVASLSFGRGRIPFERYTQPHNSSKRCRSQTTGSNGASKRTVSCGSLRAGSFWAGQYQSMPASCPCESRYLARCKALVRSLCHCGAANRILRTIARGRVYVGTQTEVDVYGLTK